MCNDGRGRRKFDDGRSRRRYFHGGGRRMFHDDGPVASLANMMQHDKVIWPEPGLGATSVHRRPHDGQCSVSSRWHTTATHIACQRVCCKLTSFHRGGGGGQYEWILTPSAALTANRTIISEKPPGSVTDMSSSS